MAKTREKPVIVLVGDEEFLKSEKLKTISDQLSANASVEVGEFDAAETPIAAILDELRTYPFLSSSRLVVLRNADKLLESAEEPLVRYVERPVSFSTLVLDFSKLDGRSKLAKALKKHGSLLRLGHMREYQVPRWLMERAHKCYGKRLSNADASFMVEMVGASPGLLDSELSKIASLAGDSKAISRSDIEAVITRGRAQTIFKLTEQVEAKNKAEALKLLDDIISRGIYDERAGGVSTESAGIAPYLLHMLNWSLGRLWRTNRLLAEGESEQDVTDQLKIHPHFKERFLSNMRRFWPRSECRRCHRELLRTDRLIKASSGEQASVLLESLIVRMCSSVRAPDTTAR